MSQFRIYSEPGDYGRRTNLAILIEGADGVTAVAQPLMFRQVEPNVVMGTYTLEGSAPNLDGRALLQAMLDHAWVLGMRPTGVADADTTKQVKALGEHLQDMRALVFSARWPEMTSAPMPGSGERPR